MDRCSSFTSHSFGKFRCFSIQKASAEDFGSIGNGLAVTTGLKEAKNDDRRENGLQAGRKNRTCHWWDKRNWSCYRETLRSGGAYVFITGRREKELASAVKSI